MPDKNKMAVFKQTNMTIFKTCTLCRHGEIPSNTTWGYCKHPGHFYDHLRHRQRLPGVSHASMGCDDFELMHEASREMVELGPYFDLLPIADDNIEEVGVEEFDEHGDDWKSMEELIHLAAVKNDIRVGDEDSLKDVLSNVLRHLHQAATRPTGSCKCGKSEGTLSIGQLPDGTPAVFCADCRGGAPDEPDDEPVEMSFKGSPKEDPDDDDEDTTAADFEEAGRLTDSAVADAHADDAEDE